MAKALRKPIGAPCRFLYNDTENDSKTFTHAAVNCNKRCLGCAWDRREKMRRLREGRWIVNELGLKQLVFKRREIL